MYTNLLKLSKGTAENHVAVGIDSREPLVFNVLLWSTVGLQIVAYQINRRPEL